MYNSLQLREVFHIEFLRWFSRKVKPEDYAIKGGVNIRFFFQSFRYSEDMDLDVRKIGVSALKDIIMDILKARAFQENLKPFGIKEIVPPDIGRAKQTETTQRFKIHLITAAGEDLFTKIEFSRRGFDGKVIVEAVSDSVLRQYKLLPLLAPHYDINSAVTHKLNALANRAVIQARDIFDLYVLIPQLDNAIFEIDKNILSKAHKHVFEVDFELFRDTVVSYLSIDDQELYNKSDSWEETRLKVAQFIEELNKKYA
jgi:predicted nucleotidyltransferase component of viral defense system